MSFPSFLSLDAMPQMMGLDSANNSIPNLNAVSGSTAHTQGAAVEVSPALPYDVAEVWLFLHDTVNRSAVQFFLGPSGSEVAVSSELVIGQFSGITLKQPAPFRFPLRLPRGERLSIRSRNSGTNNNFRCQVLLIPVGGRSPIGYANSWTVGYASGTTQPQVLTAPGGANTFGALTEITASTPARADSVFISVFFNGGFNDRWTLQIGVDPSGAPTFPPTRPIFGQEFVPARGSELLQLTMPCTIAAGSRIWARYKTSQATVPACSLALTGFY